MDKHTAGEWVVRSGQTHFAEVVTTGAKGTVVVIARLPVPQTNATTEGRRAEAKANAALIRSAPTLLDAARLARAAMAQYEDDQALDVAKAALDAAISKTEGL